MSDIPTPGEASDAPQIPEADAQERQAEPDRRWEGVKTALSENLAEEASNPARGVRMARVIETGSAEETHVLDAPKGGDGEQADSQRDGRYDIDRRLLEKAESAQEAASKEAREFSPENKQGVPRKTVAITTDGAVVESVQGDQINIIGKSEDWNDRDAYFILEWGYNYRGASMSGWNEQVGFEQGTPDAQRFAAQGLYGPDGTRFEFPAHPLDPDDPSRINPQTGKPEKIQGIVAASHAETQQIALHPPPERPSDAAQPIDRQQISPVERIYGVSRPQCVDCRTFAQTMAMRLNATIIVTGPEASRIFYNDGSVGVHLNGDDSNIYVFSPQDAWDTWQPLLKDGSWLDRNTYEKTVP